MKVIEIQSESKPNDHWLLMLFDSISLRGGLVFWWSSMLVASIFYWLASQYFPDHGIVATKPTGQSHPVSLLEAVYFSCVTTTTLGYGDFAPIGISRIIAVIQAFLGMVAVGAVLSKILTRHQERMILETNRITLEERVGRALTELHVLLNEFQDVQRSIASKSRSLEQIVRRLHNGALRFGDALRIVSQLTHNHRVLNDEIFINALQAWHHCLLEFTIACRLLEESGAGQLKAKGMVFGMVDGICDTCLPTNLSQAGQELITKIRKLCSVESKAVSS